MERVSIDWAFLTISNSSPRQDGEGVGRRIFYSVLLLSLLAGKRDSFGGRRGETMNAVARMMNPIYQMVSSPFRAQSSAVEAAKRGLQRTNYTHGQYSKERINRTK